MLHFFNGLHTRGVSALLKPYVAELSVCLRGSLFSFFCLFSEQIQFIGYVLCFQIKVIYFFVEFSYGFSPGLSGFFKSRLFFGYLFFPFSQRIPVTLHTDGF